MGGREAGAYPKRLWWFWEGGATGSFLVHHGHFRPQVSIFLNKRVDLDYGFPTVLAPEPF